MKRKIMIERVIGGQGTAGLTTNLHADGSPVWLDSSAVSENRTYVSDVMEVAAD